MIWYEQAQQMYSIDLPNHASQIKFADFCDFRQLEAKYLHDDDITGPEAAVMLRDALATIVKGSLHPLPVNHPGDDPVQMLDRGYIVQIGDPLSLNRIYAHLVTIIQDYKPDKVPQTFKMKWHGKNFTVSRAPIARVLLGTPLTTGEALEVLEYQRRASDRMATAPKDVGNIDFNLGLREFAILVRKKGEELPADRDQRHRFINQRMALFKDLRLTAVLDIRFFFVTSLIDYTQKNLLSTSGKDRQAAIVRKNRRHRENVKR